VCFRNNRRKKKGCDRSGGNGAVTAIQSNSMGQAGSPTDFAREPESLLEAALAAAFT